MSLVRRSVRATVTGFTVGSLILGSAWAAAVITKPGVVTQEHSRAPKASTVAVAEPAPSPSVGERLPGGWFLAGAASKSLRPPANKWVQPPNCGGGTPEQLYTPLTPEGCLITFDMRWADGEDDVNPLMVRSVALSNGKDTVVFSVMDVVGYMASYPADVCADCGIAQISKHLSTELGIPEKNFITSSSHTHAAPSTIAKGPTWYYEHVRDQVIASITEAVAALEQSPSVRLETGSTPAKAFNTDRRIVNRAVPDSELGWLRAYVPDEETGEATETIATIGNFSVHPTIRTANARLHSGMVGPFTNRVESKLGGAALFMPGALGDQRVDRGYGVFGLGIGLADILTESVEDGGYVLQSNDIEVARTSVQVPVENQFFVGALAVGYAIRDFMAPFGGGPATVSAKKGSAEVPTCTQTGATHIITPVSAIRFGARPPAGKVAVGPEYNVPVATDNVVLVQAPGEIFASIGLITKDYLSRSNNVLVQGIVNDTIGYIIPDNQYDLFSSEGLGLAHNALGTGNYEEALSLGGCTGELITNAMLEMGRTLGVMGEGEGV